MVTLTVPLSLVVVVDNTAAAIAVEVVVVKVVEGTM